MVDIAAVYRQVAESNRALAAIRNTILGDTMPKTLKYRCEQCGREEEVPADLMGAPTCDTDFRHHMVEVKRSLDDVTRDYVDSARDLIGNTEAVQFLDDAITDPARRKPEPVVERGGILGQPGAAEFLNRGRPPVGGLDPQTIARRADEILALPEPGVATMTEADLERAVDAIPGEDGWWKDGSAFKAAARKLVALGMPGPEAVDFLSNLYTAVAAEYGN